MPIYTKTGDKGKTSLFSGKRVLKSDIRIETYGTLDELNSLLGVVGSHLPEKKNKKTKEIEGYIDNLQQTLFYVCSYLADLPDALSDIDLKAQTDLLEQQIDSMTIQMKPLNNFIYPSGSKVATFLHLSRAVVRRAERQLVRLAQKEEIDPQVIAYINRLSDYLFTLSRYANFIEGKKEKIWQR